MKFICVKLYGGLGNQLFQYATARAVMKERDFLLLDTTHFNDDFYGRKFGLQQFNIKGKVLKNKLVSKIFTPATKLNRIAVRLGLFHLIKEEGFYYKKIGAADVRSFSVIDGYWQTEKYFNCVRDEILLELVPQQIPEMPQWITQTNTVAVHVRRTDYLKDVRYGFLGEEYYQEAINYLRQKLGNPLFVFFSDDVEWCKQTFTGDDILFCNEADWQKDYLQLYLMSKCNHQVIANSSFSWWSAWLNENKEKFIIRPKVPFRDETLCYEHYYPESWISI